MLTIVKNMSAMTHTIKNILIVELVGIEPTSVHGLKKSLRQWLMILLVYEMQHFECYCMIYPAEFYNEAEGHLHQRLVYYRDFDTSRISRISTAYACISDPTDPTVL